MKIYAISDLHGQIDGLDPKDADIVIIAGDFAPMKGCGVWHVNDQVKWINSRGGSHGFQRVSTFSSRIRRRLSRGGMSMCLCKRGPHISGVRRLPMRFDA